MTFGDRRAGLRSVLLHWRTLMAHTRSASFRVRISVRCGHVAHKRGRAMSECSRRTHSWLGQVQDPPSSRGVKLRSHAYAPIAQSVQSRAGCLENLASRGPASAMRMWKAAGLEEPAAQAAKGGRGAGHGAGEVEEGGWMHMPRAVRSATTAAPRPTPRPPRRSRGKRQTVGDSDSD